MRNDGISKFRLISSGWDHEITGANRGGSGTLRIICPFIKQAALERLLGPESGEPKVITRFDLNCFNQGVSDLSALRVIIMRGGQVRGIRHLHSKLYLFGEHSVIATSANVTDAAFRRNHEFGFFSSDSKVLATCRAYFDDLWKRGREDLTLAQLEQWERELKAYQRLGFGRVNGAGLHDYGEPAGTETPFTSEIEPEIQSNNAFIKFFGTANNREVLDLKIAKLVADDGCNWACTYPESKPPRQVKDGDTIYMARMVASDMMIFGRAIGRKHRDMEDMASEAEIADRSWRKDWPRYVRVHDGQFIDCTLRDGISFYGMMSSLGANSFEATQKNKKAGIGNTNPFTSYSRKAHMKLTAQSRAWIEERLDAALAKFGEVDLTPEQFRPPAS